MNNYPTLLQYLKNNHPTWINTLLKRIIQNPEDYWPQDTLAVAALYAAETSASQAYQARVDGKATQLDLGYIAVMLQTALLHRCNVPTFYLTRELWKSIMETPNPGEIELEKVEFSRDAMVFMLPKGSCTHPEEGGFPYIAISKHIAKKGIKFPIAERAFEIGMPVDCVSVTTYMPESPIHQFYRKIVEIKPGQTIAEAMISEAGKFDRTNDGTPIKDTNENNIRSEDIIETLWLTGIKVLLAISGGKTQIKQGRRIKTEGEPPVSWYTPNYLDILNHPPHG